MRVLRRSRSHVFNMERFTLHIEYRNEGGYKCNWNIYMVTAFPHVDVKFFRDMLKIIMLADNREELCFRILYYCRMRLRIAESYMFEGYDGKMHYRGKEHERNVKRFKSYLDVLERHMKKYRMI